jgi:hypothetical protein
VGDGEGSAGVKSKANAKLEAAAPCVARDGGTAIPVLRASTNRRYFPGESRPANERFVASLSVAPTSRVLTSNTGSRTSSRSSSSLPLKKPRSANACAVELVNWSEDDTARRALNAYLTGDVTRKSVMKAESARKSADRIQDTLAVPVPDQCIGSAKLLVRVAVALPGFVPAGVVTVATNVSPAFAMDLGVGEVWKLEGPTLATRLSLMIVMGSADAAAAPTSTITTAINALRARLIRSSRLC